MRFSFTGEIGLNGLETKNPYYKEGKSDKGTTWKRFGCSVAAEKNNRAYLELMGSEQKSIKTKDSDGKDIEIAWKSRFDEDVLNQIPYYKKHVASGVSEDERKVFITDYDLVAYLNEHAEELKGKRFTITGTTRANVYNGTVSQRFNIQNIYPAGEDIKNQLKVTTEYFFNRDSFDATEWASEHKLYINGYVETYIDKDNGNKYIPHTVVFDASKVDWENEKQVKATAFRLKQLGIELTSDNKLKIKLKGTNFMKHMIVTKYQNGAEKVEFTEDMLTDAQREAYELGLKKLEDFRAEGDVYGSRVTVYKVVDFDINGKYADGMVDTEMTANEFEENIFVVVKEESIEDLDKKISNTESESEEDDDDELFG